MGSELDGVASRPWIWSLMMWRNEAKKLLATPALWGLILACVLLNTFVGAQGFTGYAAYVGDVALALGTQVDEDLHAELALMQEPQATQQAEYLDYLRFETDGAYNIYADFDATLIAERLIDGYNITDASAQQLLRDKYALLQTSVDEKAVRGEALDLYLAGATNSEHDRLMLMVSLLTLEGALVGVLMILLLIGHEQRNRTELLLLSLRSGRRLLRSKLVAVQVLGLATFVLLWGVTMAIYIALHPYLINVWSSSVSSAFHIIPDIFAARPFITWDSFSLLGYTLAVLLVSVVLVACFILLGFFIGLRIKKTHLAFFVLSITALVLFLLPPLMMQIGAPQMVAYIINYNPVRLWINQGQWFSEGGIQYLWPRFEIWGTLGSLLVMIVLGACGYRRFRNEDIA